MAARADAKLLRRFSFGRISRPGTRVFVKNVSPAVVSRWRNTWQRTRERTGAIPFSTAKLSAQLCIEPVRRVAQLATRLWPMATVSRARVSVPLRSFRDRPSNYELLFLVQRTRGTLSKAITTRISLCGCDERCWTMCSEMEIEMELGWGVHTLQTRLGVVIWSDNEV